MKTAKELNNQILKVTKLIQKEHPELSKYLLEMHETIPDIKSPEMDKKVLKEYLNSLKEIINMPQSMVVLFHKLKKAEYEKSKKARHLDGSFNCSYY